MKKQTNSSTKDIKNTNQTKDENDLKDVKDTNNTDDLKTTKDTKQATKDKKAKKQKQTKKIKQSLSNFFTEFKKFISKGNIVDLAVAVVIGAAFNKIVSSLVDNIIMPLISLATGGVSFEDWKWVITPATYDELGNILTAETALTYGVFIQAIIDFLIIAFTIFVVLKIITNSQRSMRSFAQKINNELLHHKNQDEQGTQNSSDISVDATDAQIVENKQSAASADATSNTSNSTSTAVATDTDTTVDLAATKASASDTADAAKFDTNTNTSVTQNIDDFANNITSDDESLADILKDIRNLLASLQTKK